MGNFAPDYIQTGFHSAGYFDSWSVGTAILTEDAKNLTEVETTRQTLSASESLTHDTYTFMFRPATGILNSTKPLLPKTELILSFDRCDADLALVNKTTDNDTMTGKVLQLKNVFLTAKYSSSPFLRNYFSSISTKDVCYNYDEISVYHKNLPQGDSTIRLANIIGGNTPKYLFAGLIESDAVNGDLQMSSTCFKRHSVKEFDLTLNGYSCS